MRSAKYLQSRQAREKVAGGFFWPISHTQRRNRARMNTRHPSVTDPVASIFSKDFLSGYCFAFFKHTQMICAGYVKFAPGKPQTGQIKLKVSQGTGGG